jgi:hypothetical protein
MRVPGKHSNRRRTQGRNPVFYPFFAFCAVAVTILLRENPKGEKVEEKKRKKEEKPGVSC